MKIGLIDVDSHNFPNLALMKISAYHKSQGNSVEWWNSTNRYDIVYKSKVFTDEYSPDIDDPQNCQQLIKGGTGYDLDNKLSDEIENRYPDYGLYPQLTEDTAYGFLTRGCPRGCKFCIVAQKEGRKSVQVGNLDEFHQNQKNIKLLDPNLLACKDHEHLLEQLANSRAWVDFTQGLDVRLVTSDNIKLLNQVKTKVVHFAWDNPEDDLTDYFKFFQAHTTISKHRKPSAYVLTNFGSTHEQDLYRVYTLRELGFDPYIMIYDKGNFVQPNRRLKPINELLQYYKPNQIEHFKRTWQLQRWCNNKIIFNKQPDFLKYNPRIG